MTEFFSRTAQISSLAKAEVKKTCPNSFVSGGKKENERNH
jgi:hypothetical protein